MRIENVVRELENKSEYILFATIKDETERQAYKKLRFCYLDDKKEVLLLSRVDISDIKKENILRGEAERRHRDEQQKLIHYLDNMPIAYCTTKVLLDENKQPKDFVFTYPNYAHSALENFEYGELIGKSFYKFFKNVSYKWLHYYYDTAYNGTEHILDDYSPEVEKHLLIYTFQSGYGYCSCVVQDVAEKKKLEVELDQNQKQFQALLKATADLVFQYDPNSHTAQIILDSDIKKKV